MKLQPGGEIQGDVPGPDPARASPNKAIAGRGSLVGGSRRGLPCLGKVRDAARRRPRAGRAWSTFGPHAIGTERFATVTNGSEEPQVAGPPAQAAGMTHAGDSDCGSEGRQLECPRAAHSVLAELWR
jgi:hypothetical protein